MTSAIASGSAWPELPLDSWRPTCTTLHMWMQVVGKVCLALTPRVNHFWNIAFRVTARGLATPTLDAGGRALTLVFDFIDHRLVLQCSDGDAEFIALEPRTVAEFYAAVMQSLHRLGVDVRIWTMPVEVPDPIRFEADTVHSQYDAAWANAFWRALLSMQPVFEQFRCGFVGKCSPVHFFWGSFDLAVTRFSGRRAPLHPGIAPGVAASVMQEAYSHELSSAGFWPGGNGTDASFYSYAYPEPAGFRNARIVPDAAAFRETLGEYVLPYASVRVASDPAAAVLAFLQGTYDA